MTVKNLCLECTIKRICCYLSRRFGNSNIVVVPCPFFDTNTELCTVYDDRFNINPFCLTIEAATKQGQLPKECLYVIDNINYQKRYDIKKELRI